MAIRLLPRRLIGQTIRGIRGRLGMTPESFADAVGADGAAEVRRWENGDTQPDYGVLAKIAAMGVVDVLVFHDDAAPADTPQLTPGEASELRTILARMEALMGEARAIVERAADRTAVEALEAAASAPLPRDTGDTTLALVAEVAVEARPRRASRASSADGATSGAKSTRSRANGTTSGSSRSKEGGNGRASRSSASKEGGNGRISRATADGASSSGAARKSSTGGTRSRSRASTASADAGAAETASRPA
ncbi:MAG TPA: hypothetical protein VFQ39_06895 [Longimicrobium sp.]|nr:hypothetical protein [Longimicrobium sp.]